MIEKLFERSGEKMKAIAKFACLAGIIVSGIAGLALIVYGIILTGTSGTQGAVVWFIAGGIILLLIGSAVSWLGSLAYYALGQITENSEIRTRIAMDNAKETQNQKKNEMKAAKEQSAVHANAIFDKKTAASFEPYEGQEETQSEMDHDPEKTNVIVLINGQERCKECGTIQKSGRTVCWKCGVRFVR